MIELARGSVETWECDQMGHMNVQFYVEKADEALAALAATIGLGPKALAAQGLVLEATDHHVRFLRELRPGAAYFLRGGFVDGESAALTAYVEMIQMASGDASASFRIVASLKSAATREARAVPEGVRKAAATHRIAIPAHGKPRGLTLDAPRAAPTLDEANGMGLLRTYQGQAKPHECDAHGYWQTRFFMGRVSNAIPNLIVQSSGHDRAQGGLRGGAALEYRFIYRRIPRAGDVLAIRSGLRSVGEKTYIWGHWMFDVETGEAVATSEAVAIALDLATRKAIPLDPGQRAHLERLIVPGLAV